MKILLSVGCALITMLAPFAASQDPCDPTFADPATINEFSNPLTRERYYCEERDSGIPNSPPIPFSGYLTGNGTWCYQEASQDSSSLVYYTLQRGGVGLLGDFFPPGCDATPFEGDFLSMDDGPTLLDLSDPLNPTINLGNYLNRWSLDPAGNLAVPCLIIGEDPINDESCGDGPDTLLVGMQKAWDPDIV